MVQSYDKLGLKPLRDDAARVLEKNFPNSIYLSDASGGRKKSWWRFW
jgi:outer membrane protein assembly factor BamD